MSLFVVDTNVVLVANGQHCHVSPDCVAECAVRLQQIMGRGMLALDDDREILTEYLNKTQPKTGNRPGDAFVKWALRNHSNNRHVALVRLEHHPDREYSSFPDTSDLADFDRADRKFVAVSNTHRSKPPILQATDSKWVTWAESLGKLGIIVDFICEKDIQKFHQSKRKA